MTDRFVGRIIATKRADGAVVMQVTPGPLLVSEKLVQEGDPQLLSRDGDVLTFRGVDTDGAPLAVSYRIVGSEGTGLEGAWLMCEPVQ